MDTYIQSSAVNLSEHTLLALQTCLDQARVLATKDPAPRGYGAVERRVNAENKLLTALHDYLDTGDRPEYEPFS